MKIYIASSWKNEFQVKALAKMLRNDGHEVDAFCEKHKGRYVFHFSELGDMTFINAITFLQDERSQKAFKEDKKWIDWAETIILLLPAGKSSHLEAGYAKGQGKKLYIVGSFPDGEFDVMYGFADGLIKIEELSKLFNLLRRRN